MYNVSRMMCCGLREISGLSYYRDTEEEFINVLRTLIRDGVLIGYQGQRPVMRCGALVFTQANVRAKYGELFANRIRSLGLGQVTEIDKFTNPNTRHTIRTFIWALDKKALIAYCTERKLFPAYPASIPTPASVPPQVIR